MKVAARFPVKRSLALLALIIALHSAILLLASLKFGVSWELLICISAIFISAYFSYSQYRKITEAPDDLCWSGENWLIHSDDKLGAVIHLQLLPDSWMTSFMSLLHFSAGNRQFSWLFTRHQIGDRGYRELCFLARQNLLAQQKA